MNEKDIEQLFNELSAELAEFRKSLTEHQKTNRILVRYMNDIKSKLIEKD